LLSNAVKYTRPRDPARIEIGFRDEGKEELVIFVRDNGVGFDMRMRRDCLSHSTVCIVPKSLKARALGWQMYAGSSRVTADASGPKG